MTEAAVDFLLEKMMQLLNTEDESIPFEKDLLQSIFEDVQFLQKFLNEREREKDVLRKIRDVILEVDDIIDTAALHTATDEDTGWDAGDGQIFSFSGTMAAITTVTEEMECIEAEVMMICEKRLSLSQSDPHMAQQIHDGFTRAIQQTESIQVEVEIYERGMGLTLRQSHTVHDFLFSWFEKAINLAQKFVHAFDCFIREIQFINSLMTVYQLKVKNAPENRKFPAKESDGKKSAINPPFFCPEMGLTGIESQTGDHFLSGRVIFLAKNICCDVSSFMEDIKSIKSKFTVIREDVSNVAKPGSDIPADFFSTLSRMVRMAERIREGFDRFWKGIESIEKETTMTCQKGWSPSSFELYVGEKIFLGFGWVTAEIKSIKTEVKEVYKKEVFDVRAPEIQNPNASLRSSSPVVEGETVVGFEDEKTEIIDLLTGEQGKKLKLIQIVGMPGLGKTTLAMKVYTDPLITYHFHIRAWTCVSQVYRKRDVLLSILNSHDFQRGDEMFEMSDDKLGQKLYKCLKGKRYLIVMDDIWNVGVWDDLRRYFPNDNNGSRIMFTSRAVVIERAKSHPLRFLNEDESWILLQAKAFGKGDCPQELVEIGKEIARKCEGLPLAIVVISGVLAKNEKTQEFWGRVAQSVSSYIASDEEQYMSTLALSYNHLPHHLKPCFLYFGAFSEGYEIPVWKLIWLWIAEGFIQKKQHKSLEEVAENYLMNLVDRNLVIVSKKRSNGEIKACRIHDLLRDLCWKEAEEENCFAEISRFEQISSTSSSSSSSRFLVTKHRRISINSNHRRFFMQPYGLYIRSFLSFSHSLYKLSGMHLSFVCQCFKLLRVLDLSSLHVHSFPAEITQLLHLRYLALTAKEPEKFNLAMSNLWSLETFILDGRSNGLLVFDDIIWKLVKLRHMYTKRLIEIPFETNSYCSFTLNELQTMGKLDLRGLDVQVLKSFPNLRKLRCSFMESWGGECDVFPKLKFLTHLEALNVIYDGFNLIGRFPHVDDFPPNLKSLTLSKFGLPWEEMSTLGRLPNLQVLKLSYKAFRGPRWDTIDGGFGKLRFLKFRGLDIKQWNASNSHFPSLQILIFDDCKLLEEIPSNIGDIFTLEMIQLRYCGASAAKSVRQIKEEQLSKGNHGLEIFIHSYHCEIDESEDEDVAT